MTGTNAANTAGLRLLLKPSTVRTPFAHDAALPGVSQGRFASARDSLLTAFAQWDSQIASERCEDYTLALPSLRMDPRDGALTRDAGAGLSYTPRGWAMLVNLMLYKVPKEANTANVIRVECQPDARSLVFDSFKARSKRGVEPVVFRTFLDQRTGTRALRAVVTPRHALTAYDDRTVLRALGAELSHDSRAYFVRTPDRTWGRVVLPNPTPTGCGSIRSVVHFGNSETACASISFTGGAHLDVIDTEVSFETSTVTRETEIQLADDDARTTRRHTMPARFGIEKATEVALTRLRADVRTVVASCERLPAMWNAALANFPEGYGHKTFEVGDAKMRAAVLCDALEERGLIKAEERSTIEGAMASEERLGRIPQGSAAHVAACYAVVARECKSYETAREFQALAGEWIAKGWKR